MTKVVIVDYGMGNLHSAAKAISKVLPRKGTVRVSAHPQDLAQADRVVLPGVGAMGDCMAALNAAQWPQALQVALGQKPFLGICVGMQMLFSGSEESGGVAGLNLFSDRVVSLNRRLSLLKTGSRYKVPHMGWNQVRQTAHPLWQGIADESRFYFVHSFAVPVASVSSHETVIGQVNYGCDWVCAVARDNVAAVQFHPEKSHDHGLKLLHNFVRWEPGS